MSFTLVGNDRQITYPFFSLNRDEGQKFTDCVNASLLKLTANRKSVLN